MGTPSPGIIVDRPVKFKKFRETLMSLKLRNFQPKVHFEIRSGDYVVKTADSRKELLDVLDLRYQVFIKNRIACHHDLDRYDLLADHLLVRQLSTGKVVGTYRTICSLFSKDFYSANEFRLDDFLATDGIKLELGRASIASEARNGMVLNMIWKGIARYIQLTNTRYLFGCSSSEDMSIYGAMKIFRFLEKDHFTNQLNIWPLPEYQFPVYRPVLEVVEGDGQGEERRPVEEHIPPLLYSYIKAGAKIHSLPALDRQFKTADFFTILDMNEINPKHYRRYFTMPE